MPHTHTHVCQAPSAPSNQHYKMLNQLCIFDSAHEGRNRWDCGYHDRTRCKRPLHVAPGYQAGDSEGVRENFGSFSLQSAIKYAGPRCESCQEAGV